MKLLSRKLGDYVNKAADFLRNPKVYKSARDHQEEFLKSKGLTDDEVQLAFQRANVLIQEDQRIQMSHPPPPTALAVQSYPNYMFPQPTRWTKFRDMGNMAALLASLAYGLYLFYKKYIQPYLFVRKKHKTAEELMLELKNLVTSSLITLREELRSVHNDLNGVQEQITHESEAVREIQERKMFLVRDEGMFINQFPPLPSTAPLSLPSWQLSELEGEEKEDGADSGSGSSGTEVVAKNGGSDSSLEMIRE
uniref:Peroxisomal membrane protein PEX14 n=1 Tax=Timema poppense TaxID=170557 RepID=A0A7R9CS47_TIMPO|nr:unnamed protein product [Timema poppensis]